MIRIKSRSRSRFKHDKAQSVGIKRNNSVTIAKNSPQKRDIYILFFREANEFAGKKLLLIGSSYSAEDIAMQCVKYRPNPCLLFFPFI